MTDHEPDDGPSREQIEEHARRVADQRARESVDETARRLATEEARRHARVMQRRAFEEAFSLQYTSASAPQQSLGASAIR